ncbi:MAG: peroxidase-related enzyme [Caldilineaceae bacterium]|nr:peroxidase-related enzyme [Caldilineaceae bacterium]
MSEKLTFTAEPVDWQAWLPPLALEDATPAQVAVLEESTPTAKSSPYYLLLVQDVAVLRERSRLYNAIMYGPRGLPRAEREWAVVAVSRVNGCVYCASVHAQRFIQLTKKPALVQRLLTEGVEIAAHAAGDPALEPRPRAIIDFAVKLTRTPTALTAADLAPLRQVGLTDAEILDLTHAVAMFAWANRLMQTLGEPVLPTPRS